MNINLLNMMNEGKRQLSEMRTGEHYYCPTCDKWLVKSEVHQVIREECCLEACNVCDSTITDYSNPF